MTKYKRRKDKLPKYNCNKIQIEKNAKRTKYKWSKIQIKKKQNTPTGASTNPKNFDLNLKMSLI